MVQFNHCEILHILTSQPIAAAFDIIGRNILLVFHLGLASMALLYKRRAVAAQTTRSHCKLLSIQYVYYFRITKGKWLYRV